ncbi:MAG: class I lanthipeptide [Thermoanaerobaculia bacterium]
MSHVPLEGGTSLPRACAGAKYLAPTNRRPIAQRRGPMRKKAGLSKKLLLSKETIRHMLSDELRQVGGAGPGQSCGDDSACDCSSYDATSSICTNQGTLYCTHYQY